MKGKKYRLLTRSDLDGLICAVLMRHLDMVEQIVLIDHPSTMQEGLVKVSETDIITNLPYVDGAHLAFDHHLSETLRNRKNPAHIIDPDAPSAARVIYEYYGGKTRFPEFFDDIMEAVDKADSGSFSRREILNPTGWTLLNFLVDKRTGIEEWGKFAISEKQFKLNLIDWIGKMPVDEILQFPDVAQRAEVYFQYEKKYKKQLETSAVVNRNIIILDCRSVQQVYPGNRFIVYALYPQCNVSIQIKQEPEEGKITFSVGKSIINTTSDANIGQLMLQYGGGGHRAAGACHVPVGQAGKVLAEIIEALSDSD
ncbi:MAG: exopolyphosphatase [Desulfobacterales bacterium]|nr:exopolyphosphatase [Desulfobacterales bacterium]